MPTETRSKFLTVWSIDIVSSGNPWAWKPGQSGNPRGGAARKPITELYRRTIMEPCEHPEILSVLGLPEGSTWGAVLVKAAYIRAAEGNVQAINEITNRVDGPVDKPEVEEPLDTTGTPLEVAARIVARVRARLAAANAGHVPEQAAQTVDGEAIEHKTLPDRDIG
jgi:Family of unknown function (DUF5681)